MADQESWIERRQRRVKCKPHGLHYDPDMASGCALCIKEGAKNQPKRAPQFTMVLLSTLGMAVVLYQIFGPEQGGEDELLPLGPAPEAEAASARLDPDAYRPQIEALETVIFAPVEEPRELENVGLSIAAAAQNLSEEIRRRQPDSQGIDILGRLVPSAEGFSFDRLERARNLWQRVRKLHFAPASWFVAPVESGGHRARMLLAEYQEIAQGLRGLLEEGASEARAMATDDGDGGVARFGDQDDGWGDYLADWRQRIDALWQRRPGRPATDTDPQMLSAIQDLERAFQRAWSLSSSARASESATRFEEVLALAESAQRSLSDIRL